MEASKIDMYMVSNARFFAPEAVPFVRSLLQQADDSKFYAVQALGLKDPTTLLIVSLFAGGFGVDRFMLGETGLGVAKLLTCGGLGIWTVIDWFLIMGKTKELNLQKLQVGLM